MARLFLSYASPDRVFAERLAESLTRLGHVVWIDHWEIAVGEVLPAKIAAGITAAEYVVVILSPYALQSAWVEREVHIATYDEITQRRPRLIPVVIADCTIPPLLRPKRLADFRVAYEIGLVQLSLALYTARKPPNESIISSDNAATDYASAPLPIDLGSRYTHGMGYKVPRLSEVTVELALPYVGKISGMWKPDEAEQRAAWELYVELVTRVSATGLQPGEGLLRESLSSLYAIFTTTRALLRSYGPTIARPAAEGGLSFGIVAVQVLNYVLRPVLSTWHPLLLDYEHQRDPTVSVWEHEKKWEKTEELRSALLDTRRMLVEYTNLLAQVAGVPELVGK